MRLRILQPYFSFFAEFGFDVISSGSIRDSFDSLNRFLDVFLVKKL